jgi:calcineurin-like phosphoesterase family protein
VKFCQRPGFKEDGNHWYDRHNQLIIENWNNCIDESTSILHLGDVYFGGWDEGPIAESRDEVIMDLPGHKFLILGNHDIEYGKEHFEALGWEVIQPFWKIVDGIKIYFTHYPMQVVPPNCLNVHGHVHNNYIDALTRNHINVGVDMRGMSPVPAKTICDNGIYRITKENQQRDHSA